jgi:Uncharacterized alpha/beta hydrolase domain (DUF2235)
MTITWPNFMPDGGRLSKKEADAAWATGVCRVMDPKMSCPKTLHITLFFDGTNNNDDRSNPHRDSLNYTHTNVARLFKAAVADNSRGIFPFYIPGVGTPLRDIGELLYTSKGKAFADGFAARCVLGYVHVLNAVYQSIVSDKTRGLIDHSEVRSLCDNGANDKMAVFNPYVRRLGVAHEQAVDESAFPRTVRKIWINVIGFSRGAAAARVFVHKLINEWAPGGKLGEQSGKYALPYQVNFMGLFDTVASVGLPDSTRAVVNVGSFDGHFAFASGGSLDIPESAQFCYHAFSIHEQRMSFPLDSIRQGNNYPSENLQEVAYPGVHSDLGGGYGPGEQGKACDEKGAGDDSRKLSQIPLHDMYIAALKHGVPMKRVEELQSNKDVWQDFLLHPETIEAFNAWLKTVERERIKTVEDAIKFGLAQMLSWRTLRARIGTSSYVTEQKFFQRATEHSLTPHKVYRKLEDAKKDDPELLRLKREASRLADQYNQALHSSQFIQNPGRVKAIEAQVTQNKDAQRQRIEALCGHVAYPNAQPPRCARPGEGAYDICTNDKTDLRQSAEEMRLLLGFLYPEQRPQWQVDSKHRMVYPNAYTSADNLQTLSVKHEQPDSDSPAQTLAVSGILLNTLWTAAVQNYDPKDDVLAAPVKSVIPFLKQHTSEQAVAQLPLAATKLFDDFVHDSRCWFRVPYFHEYAPGGYGWPRVVFVGKDNRLPYLGLASISEPLDLGGSSQAA